MGDRVLIDMCLRDARDARIEERSDSYEYSISSRQSTGEVGAVVEFNLPRSPSRLRGRGRALTPWAFSTDNHCNGMPSLMDIYSRYVVGWLLAHEESAELAEELIATSFEKQMIGAEQLTIHADGEPSMTSRTVK